MQKKNYWLIFGAVVAVVILLSSNCVCSITQSSFAVDVSQTNKRANKEVNVDPNIHLTQKHLPLLKRSLMSINDPDFKMLVQGIIQLLNSNKKVDSSDILKILYNSGITKISFHTGFINGYGPGSTVCFPGLFFRIYVGPTTFLAWNAFQHSSQQINIDVKINGFQRYTTEHEGVALLFTGLKIQDLETDVFTFTIIGFSPLIIVKRI